MYTSGGGPIPKQEQQNAKDEKIGTEDKEVKNGIRDDPRGQHPSLQSIKENEIGQQPRIVSHSQVLEIRQMQDQLSNEIEV